eukprot:scaffold77420_cov63-Phaeocystis_antarctica.AAC.3
MEISVCGCRSPRVSRHTFSASRSSGSAAARSPLACSSPPKLLMEVSVCGCRSPRVSRHTFSASRSSGSAAARSPLACSSPPKLLMEVSVLGCRMPRVLRFPSSASRYSGSAAARSPLACSSSPRLLIEINVTGYRSPRVSRATSSTSRNSGCCSPGVAYRAILRLSLVVLALGLQLLSEGHGEGVQGEPGALTSRALGLEPCTQKLEAQRIAVMVHALAAAVGRVLLWALTPPSFEAVSVDQLGGAAAGARLHERAVVLALQAQPALLVFSHATEACHRAEVSRGVNKRTQSLLCVRRV